MSAKVIELTVITEPARPSTPSIKLTAFESPTSSTEELSYTTFMQKVENKEIKSVDMMKDSLIAVPVKQPEAKKTEVSPWYGEVKPPQVQYKVAFPENSDILKDLEKNGVEINVKRASESGSMFGLGSSFLTILLVLGFVFLIIKSIQAGGAQAMSFGKSRAKMIIMFSALAGSIMAAKVHFVQHKFFRIILINLKQSIN